MNAELTEITDFLAQHDPFNDLPSAVLANLAEQLFMEYHRRGTKILTVGSQNEMLYILRSGAVDVLDEDGALVDRGDAGTCFGSDTLLEPGLYRFEVLAIEDCLVLVMPGAVFHEIAAQHPLFGDHFRELAGRMQEAVASMHIADRGVAVLRTRVQDMIRKAPLTVDRDTSIREAAQLMRQHKMSSVLVMDGPRLLGMVTNTDMRDRVVAEGRDIDDPLTSIMTTDLVTAPALSLAVELLLDMVGRNVHHIPVVDDAGRILGVVSSGDLVRLQHADPVVLTADVASQDTLDELIATSQRLPAIVEQLVTEDASADAISRVVTAVGDAIERRLIHFAEAELGPPPVPYCWVVLGSQARMEQGLSSDQDNAVVLSDHVTPADGEYFEQLARKVSDGLASCGYPYCPGDVMATNPQWRQTLSQWTRTFHSWMARPEPTAVLNAQVFFDMRALHGDHGLVDALREKVLKEAPTSRRFLAHLAKQTVEHHPPLGFFRGFVLEKAGEHKSTLDLKAGSIAIVQMARVHALTLGSPAVNTHQRLSADGPGLLDEDRRADLRDAYEFISYVRLRHQGRTARAGHAPNNFVPPDELTNFEQAHLRDAFQIVRKAQSAVQGGFLVQYIS